MKDFWTCSFFNCFSSTFDVLTGRIKAWTTWHRCRFKYRYRWCKHGWGVNTCSYSLYMCYGNDITPPPVGCFVCVFFILVVLFCFFLFFHLRFCSLFFITDATYNKFLSTFIFWHWSWMISMQFFCLFVRQSVNLCNDESTCASNYWLVKKKILP